MTSHKAQQGVSLAWGVARVPVESSNRDVVYTVKCARSLDNGTWVAHSCTCPNGEAKRSKVNCYHLELALEILESRRALALERARELVEGAKLAGWTQARYMGELERLRITSCGDAYAATLALESLLASRGIVRDDTPSQAPTITTYLTYLVESSTGCARVTTGRIDATSPQDAARQRASRQECTDGTGRIEVYLLTRRATIYSVVQSEGVWQW